jgi:hypothetical protein
VAARGARARRPPFEFCCITPTHSLFLEEQRNFRGGERKAPRGGANAAHNGAGGGGILRGAGAGGVAPALGTTFASGGVVASGDSRAAAQAREPTPPAPPRPLTAGPPASRLQSHALPAPAQAQSRRRVASRAPGRAGAPLPGALGATGEPRRVSPEQGAAAGAGGARAASARAVPSALPSGLEPRSRGTKQAREAREAPAGAALHPIRHHPLFKQVEGPRPSAPPCTAPARNPARRRAAAPPRGGARVARGAHNDGG